MTILLGKKELRDKKALMARKAYLQSLLNERRPSAGPSSQEWVSDEYYHGHRSRLQQEIAEVNKVLKDLEKREAE